MQNDSRPPHGNDPPDSNAAFHHVPGDLADTETAAARETRLSGPGGSAAGAHERHAAEGVAAGGDDAPPVIDETHPGKQRPPSTEEGNLRHASDTWTTKGNPLA